MVLKGRQVAVLILGVVLAGAIAAYGATRGCVMAAALGVCPNSKGYYERAGPDTSLLWFTIAAVVFIVAVVLALSPWARGTDTKG